MTDSNHMKGIVDGKKICQMHIPLISFDELSMKSKINLNTN